LTDASLLDETEKSEVVGIDIIQVIRDLVFAPRGLEETITDTPDYMIFIKNLDNKIFVWVIQISGLADFVQFNFK
jgi:hypothetical protein